MQTLIRFVNSTGFMHQVDDLYRWTANLIRGTGAVMGISIIPNVTLNELNVAASLTTTTASNRTTTVDSNSTTFTFESLWMRRLADKCRMINDMGIPVLLRFAPDMNGMLFSTPFLIYLIMFPQQILILRELVTIRTRTRRIQTSLQKFDHGYQKCC